MLLDFFALVIIWVRSCFLVWANLDHDPLIYASHCSWNDRQSPLYLAIGWDRVSWTICPGWPWTVILLISASQVARITCVRHQCPALFAFCPGGYHSFLDYGSLQFTLGVRKETRLRNLWQGHIRTDSFPHLSCFCLICSFLVAKKEAITHFIRGPAWRLLSLLESWMNHNC
jgi:hypothetical protein